MEPSTPSDPLTEPFVVLLDIFTRVLEAVEGYRARCLQAGFSPEASEHMALELHHIMLTQIANHQ